MSLKWKACLSIFIFALSFFMLIETKYLPPLGDLVLERIGIQAWSNGDTGFHLTVLYFGLVALISYISLKVFAQALKMKGITIFIIFIVLVTSFSYITSATAQYLKSQSDGLYAIALVRNDEANRAHYETRDFKVTDFEIDLTLKNYGKNEVTFFIEFEPFIFDEEPVQNLKIVNKDGSKAEFILEPGKTHRFVITGDLYQLTGGMRSEHGSYGLSVNEVILSNNQGEVILLKDNSIIAGLLIHK